MSDLLDLRPRTRWLGRPHEHFAELASTNDRALAWARAGAPHGAMVSADRQTAGRGRLGRAWASPAAGDLYVSVILRPPQGPALGALALAVGAGLREGLARWTPQVALKWPNDVLLAGRKVAGVLCEARWVGDLPELVVGFGVNVGRTLFDPELAARATSLALALPSPPPRAAVLSGLLAALEPILCDFFAGGFAAVRARYEPHCVTLGARVSVEVPGGTGEREPARALGLDPDGALLVAPLDGGPARRVESGDVWLEAGDQREE